jgi:SOS-response transcriptional repressor LexA
MPSGNSEKSAKFSENLARLHQLLGGTLASIEKYLGLSNGYINNLIKQKAENPGRLLLSLNEKGISTDWFLTGEGQPFLANSRGNGGLPTEQAQPPVQTGQEVAKAAEGGYKVRLLRQQVSCGPGVDWETDDNVEEYIDVFSILPRLATGRMYAFKASGSSMLGAGIRSGDYLIFDAELGFIPKDDIYIFTLDGEVYCKRLEFDMLAKKLKIYSVRVADLEKAELVRTLDMTEVSFGDRFRILGRVRYLLRPNRGED